MDVALLKSIMAMKGINQGQLAAALHRTQVFVSNVFHGKAEFALKDIRIIKELLELTPEQIDAIFLP